jgi:colicin import membrane protein
MNTITKVAVKSGVVEITGSQKPSFSTFPMTDPPRLVVDISGAVFSGVPEAMDVTSGHVVAIKTASYGSNASAIARVVIGFDRDVEPDIQTVGNKLVVRSSPAPGSASVAQATPPSAPGPSVKASEDAAAAASAASASGAAVAASDERRRQDSAAAAAAEKERQDASASAAAAEDKRRQDFLAAAAAAEKQRQDASAAAAAAAEKRRLDEAAASAAADDKRRHDDAAAAAAAEEKRRQDASAAASAEEQRRQQEVASARTQQERQQAAAAAAAAEEQRKQQAALAAAAAETQRKQEAAAAAAAVEERRRQDGAVAAAAEQRRQTETAQAAEQRRAQDTKVAAAAETAGRQDLLAVAPRGQATAAGGAKSHPAPASSEPVSIEGGSSGGSEASGRRKALTFVGFDEKGPRVYVRTNGPVRYSVSTGAKNTVVVELDNTSIPLHNNSRTLDTAFFAGPVLRIQPERGPKNSVRVAITLRDAVAYQAHQDGNEVSVQFRAP